MRSITITKFIYHRNNGSRLHNSGVSSSYERSKSNKTPAPATDTILYLRVFTNGASSTEELSPMLHGGNKDKSSNNMFQCRYVWDCLGTKLNLHGVLSRRWSRAGLSDNYQPATG